ncbi:uncharacterized protein [Diadema setosum]|uniref:uncharacterized protein n=1 Tax=Diadema setosum TaxID=31175 RepID=UPI003B3A6A3C
MGFRRSFIGFTGAVQILLTMAVFSLTTDAVLSVPAPAEENHASGIPLWGGLIILMCGAANLVSVLGGKKKKSKNSFLPISLSSFMANTVAFLTSSVVIGLFSWAMAEDVTANSSVGANHNIYVISFATVIAAMSIICILSLMALFADCFTVCFSTPSLSQHPYPLDGYDMPPRYPQMHPGAKLY